MVYTSDIFKNLITKYSNWQSLSSYLQSPEGGSIRIIQKEGDAYAILRYVKGQSDLSSSEKPWVRWMRSVVWDVTANRPICVAPPKAYNTDIPSRSVKTVEEFVEGVMVNAFVDALGNLHFATRSALEAGTGFYGTKTFAEMMREALNLKNLTAETLAKELTATGFQFASFVLQHPEHRVVQKIDKPNVYLIHCGSVDADCSISIEDSIVTWPVLLTSLNVPQYQPLDISQGEDAARRLDTMIRSTEATWQGLVFRGTDGDRWRLRSLSYKILRDLRGKESRLEDRFCRVRAQNMSRIYTQNWPEEQQKFFELEKRLRGLTSKIYTEYCAVHKEKSKVFLDVPVPLRTPIYELHGIYLNNLRPKHLTLKMPIVIQYVNNLPVEAQGALLRSSVEVDLTQGET